MKATPIFFASPLERIRRERRQRVISLWVSIAVFVALSALAGWLLYLIKVTGLTGVAQVGGLAMAPVWQGSIMGLLAFLMVIGTWAAVRKVKRDHEFYASLRRQQDMFEPLREPRLPIPAEDVFHILVACAAEQREVQRLVKHALTTLSVEDYEDALEVAHDRLTTLVACMESLCERLGAQEPTKIMKQGGAEA